MKKFNKLLSLLLALVMAVTLLPAGALAVVGDQTANSSSFAGENDSFLSEEGITVSGGVTVQQTTNPGVDLTVDNSKVEQSAVAEMYSPNDVVRVIVVLEGKSLLERGYTTQQIASGTDAVNRQVASMKLTQGTIVNRIKNVVNASAELEVKSVEVRYNFTVTTNAMSLDVPFGALEKIQELDGVVDAFVAPQYSLPEDMTDETVSPSMYATSTSFGSAQTWNELGYTGEGMRIAIIDTGLDLDHPSFAAEPNQVGTSLTVDEIAGVLTNLNAYKLYGNTLTAEDLYRSGKVPYGFNYIDASLDVTHDNDQQGDHGTHVSGIAAANKMDSTSVVGVAPDAQLIVMKVFGKSGSPYADDLVAALEDCFWLNVDAVNMSLGSTAGFTSSGVEFIDAVYDRIAESDMIVSISAGNEYSAAYGNTWGTNTNLTSDPDNGLVGSPGTYGGTMVGSIENSQFMIEYMMLGERKIPYYDATYVFAYYMAPTEATEYEYIMIPGVGAAADYEGLDVSGKIAVVQRGEIDFVSKQSNALAAGAVACVVYNNVSSDELLYMQDGGEILNIFISLEDGLALAEAANENGVGTLKVMAYGDMIPQDNPYAGQMSDFSSWGVTPDLQLAPDVSAPGGNIYSTYTDGQYGTMSGTSMSAPHIAGMGALVLQYLRDQYDLASDSETHTVAESLIMSTATPLVEPSGELYSPRKQGAGSANVYAALTSEGYLTVDGGKPSVSLGDDDDKTGVYEFSFEINNLTDEEQAYVLSASVLTDLVDTTYAAYDLYFMGETSVSLTSDVEFSVQSVDYDLMRFDANQDGILDIDDVQYLLDYVNKVSGIALCDESVFDMNGDTVLNTADAQALYELVFALPTEVVEECVLVPANSSLRVYVTVTLSDEDKAYMDAYYPNGIYVDGFVHCEPVNGEVALGLPFMGFYGDWSKAGKVFDTGWYYDEDAMYDRYVNVMWTNFDGDASGYLLGLNPYIADDPYDPSHNVISPNGDGYQDVIDDMYLSLMRGVKELSFAWKDENGEVLAGIDLPYVRKTFYVYSVSLNYPFVWTNYVEGYYDYIDENGDPLPDGTVVDLVINAYLDDGDNVVDDNIVIPTVVDTTAPEIKSVEYLYDEATDSRKLQLTIYDNHDTAALIPLTTAGDPIEYIAVNGDKDENGETCVLTLDVSGYDSTFILALGDYGVNENYYTIEFKGENNVDFGKFYGYRRYSAVPYGTNYYYATAGYNGWVSYSDPGEMTNHTFMYDNGETAVDAAEYIDGYIFGVDVEGEIFAMKSGDWTRIPLGTMPTGYDADYDYVTYPALDMAYDYTRDVLYILTDELVAGAGGHLMTLDYMTGTVTDLGIVVTADGSQALTLACDNDGMLYTIDYVSGDLYTIDMDDPDTVVEGQYWWNPSYIYAHCVGETGYVPLYAQSMTVDHDTNTLYWQASSGVTRGYSYLLQVDKTTGAVTPVFPAGFDGTSFPVEYNSEITALYKPYDSGKDIISDADIEQITLNKYNLAMSAGTTVQLVATPYPFNSELGELTWTSSAPDSVAVSSSGEVHAFREGTAVITVTSGAVSAECVVEVVSLESDLVIYDMYNEEAWVSLNASDPTAVECLENAVTSYNGFTAAAYFNGYVYAGEDGGSFYRLDAETMQGNQIGSSGSTLMALAFNYDDGYMYGVEQYSAGYWDVYNYVVRVNLNTGAIVRLGLFNNTYTPLGYMAIDYDGNFYSICGNNYTYAVELVQWTADDEGMTIVTTWDISDYATDLTNYTSMTYSAQDNGIYFTDGANILYWIDAASLVEDGTPRVVNLGYVGGESNNAMNLGMFTIPDEEPELPEVAVTGVTAPSSYMLLVGGTVSAGITVAPWNTYPEITYTMTNEDIATVDAKGNITGASAGETTLTVTVEGWDTTYQIPVTVVEPAGILYGFLISDFMYSGNMFVSFADTDPVNEIEGLTGETEFAVYSGAYYDGMIYGYGQDQTGEYDYKNYFLIIDPTTYEIEVGAKVHYTLRDMAFDYTSGNLYAIAEGSTVTSAVAQVNTETGEVTIVSDTGKDFAAMTITADGKMYGISEDGNLYLIDKDTGATTLVGSVGVDVGATFQSMHYDLNSGNTYWAQVADDQTSSLRIVNLLDGSTTNLGTISPSGAMIGAMYTVPENEATEPDTSTTRVTGVEMDETATVVVGETIELTAIVLTSTELVVPGSIQTQGVQTPSVVPVEVDVEWSSSNADVATVDEYGVVTGVSAGVAVITATVDDCSASCQVTVTAGERMLYTYDMLNNAWIKFSASDPSKTTVVRDDTEDETALQAAVYTGTTIYACDVNGSVYTIDPDTFDRTDVGTGISDWTYTVEAKNWFGDTYEVECDLTVNSMAYDQVTGKLYAVVDAVNEDEWVEYTLICEVDKTTGDFTVIYESNEIKPGNLLVMDGVAFFVDCYWSGILTKIDLNDDAPEYEQYALIQDYWGNNDAGRGLYLDPLTGTVYAIRDYVEPEYDDDWNEYYAYGESTLCILNLSDGDIVEVGTIGENLLLNSLFMR